MKAARQSGPRRRRRASVIRLANKILLLARRGDRDGNLVAQGQPTALGEATKVLSSARRGFAPSHFDAIEPKAGPLRVEPGHRLGAERRLQVKSITVNVRPVVVCPLPGGAAQCAGKPAP